MYKNWIVLCLMLFLFACTSKTERLKEQIVADTTVVETKLQNLSSGLKNQTITNAGVLKQYAAQLRRSNSEYRELVNLLAKNADVDGPMYQTLAERLKAVKQYSGDSLGQLDDNLLELEILSEATHPTTFNDALSDPVNVLADLSEGKLPRVQSIKRKQEISANKSQDYGKGSQLIGNPQYGSWSSGSRGMSVWEWYGAYALFSNLTGGNRYSYSDWGRSRPYSYYHDYGRSRYTKPSALKQQNQLQARTEKSFKQQGKRFSSPYAKKRTGASGLSKASQSRPSSGSFRNASSFRKSGSSSGRRAQSRTSRGPSRGK